MLFKSRIQREALFAELALSIKQRNQSNDK